MDIIDLKCDLQRAVNAYNKAVAVGNKHQAAAFKTCIDKIQRLINRVCQ